MNHDYTRRLSPSHAQPRPRITVEGLANGEFEELSRVRVGRRGLLFVRIAYNVLALVTVELGPSEEITRILGSIQFYPDNVARFDGALVAARQAMGI